VEGGDDLVFAEGGGEGGDKDGGCKPFQRSEM